MISALRAHTYTKTHTHTYTHLCITPLKLACQEVAQPAFQQRHDASQEEEPHTPHRGPEAYSRALAHRAGVEAVVDEVLQVLCVCAYWIVRLCLCVCVLCVCACMYMWGRKTLYLIGTLYSQTPACFGSPILPELMLLGFHLFNFMCASVWLHGLLVCPEKTNTITRKPLMAEACDHNISHTCTHTYVIHMHMHTHTHVHVTLKIGMSYEVFV
jgi:hypothetical protein